MHIRLNCQNAATFYCSSRGTCRALRNRPYATPGFSHENLRGLTRQTKGVFKVCCSKKDERNRIIIKYTKYATVVSRAFGVDPTVYIVPGVLAVVGLSALSVAITGITGLMLFVAAAFGLGLASIAAFLSLGWLFLPLTFVVVLGSVFAVTAGAASLFFLLPLGFLSFFLLSGFYLLQFVLSKVESVDEIVDMEDSLQDDVLERIEMERFDRKLRERSRK